MKLFVVTHIMKNMSKEDKTNIEIAGIFTEEKIAEIVSKSSDSIGKVTEIEVDKILPSYVKFAKEVLNIDLEKIQREKELGFKDLSEFDRECIMPASEFLKDKENGFLIPSDGDGYWATENFVSKIWCFSEQPAWATHVCWYNN